MSNLSQISGIGKSSLELLEAAGFSSAESLAKAGIEELALELDRANSILKIAKRAPARGNIEKWIASARELAGVDVNETVPVKMPVNYEITPKVTRMLEDSPFAIPLPGRFLMEQKLGVADIPPGILLNRYSGDLEVRVEDRVPASKARPLAPSSNVRIADNSATRIEIDASRFKSTDEIPKNAPRTQTNGASSDPDNERVHLIRAPRVETNAGRDPQSRRYIRGVLHNHAASLTIGAVVTLVLMVVVPLAVASATLLLLSSEYPERFSWTPKWLLVFPFMLPLLGILYLIFSLPGNCRICGQKLFVPRACLKNSKAHHVKGLGYILPLSIHMLLYKWFRCTYCGTPVRLKK